MPGPLTSLRVIEFAGIGPAPFCGMLLADLGADVICVERPGPAAPGASLPREIDVMQRGKRSIVIDLKQQAGIQTAQRLVSGADVLLEGFRPGVMERLGLGPDRCLLENPRLVYGRMTGWGQDGPLSQQAGHDAGYLALTGALHAIGRAGGPPQIPLNLVGDFGGGALYLAFGVLAAVLEARQSGHGQVVDAAIVDGVASMLGPIYALLAQGWWRDRRGVNLLDSGAPFYDVYETADGEHVAVVPIEPKFYAEFLRLAGLADAELPDQWDLRSWPRLRERFAAVIRTRTRDEWARVFDGSDACVVPVLSLREAAASEHARARGTYLVEGKRIQPAPAPRFSRTPGEVRHGPPIPGRDTRAVLLDAGFDATAVEALLREGVACEAEEASGAPGIHSV